ncbi:carbon-nitrogen hydrolase family protein [Alteribacillus sp. YIM 98480]|uniref:carbon-nitrogen hydrolase family protein n=1 Tax=Alteribacillus sp. YIM 98480 TaxID=2606599 RepID=UPI00131BB55D|nr:carbon-nitrogen hydrolase family protein [Alteribacillus sp. YIM 98480]
MKVAAVQMNPELNNKEANKEKTLRFISEAVQQNAKVIVIPELFSTGYRVEENDFELSESIPGPTTSWLEDISKQYDVTLIACILETSHITGYVYDTAFIVSPNGLIGKYRKVHLWDQEIKRFSTGDEFPVFDVEGYKIGMQICYEIGFPEGSRILASKGADIIVYPSAFGKKRLYAWNIASRSRALENGCYVIAANRIGIEKNETEFGGHSKIINPQGEVLNEAGAEEGVIVNSIDKKSIATQRVNIPYLRDLKYDLFYRK